MGHFFFGVFAGLLFSSLLYLVLLAGGFQKPSPWGFKEFLLEFLTIAAAFAVIVLLWAPADLDWIRRYLIPIKLVQVLLGIGTGVFMRVWLTRKFHDYLHPKTPRTPRPGGFFRAAANSGNTANIPPLPNKGEPAKGDPSAQDLAIGFLAVVLIAVLLPYLEDMVRRATTIKVGTVEVTVKNEQKSQALATLAATRERQRSRFLSIEEPEKFKERLGSDARRYAEQERHAIEQANAEFTTLYEHVLYPFVRCIGALFDQGWEFDAVKAQGRSLAGDWLVVVNKPSTDPAAAANIRKMITTADGTVKKWSAVNPDCKSINTGAVAGLTPRVRDTFMFHWFLSDMLAFLDDRLGAIQNLERVDRRFREHELNLANLLGSLYYEEDPTLTKSIEYYELALRIAEKGLDQATNRLPKPPSCPAQKGALPVVREVCYDLKRYKDAVTSYKNTIAFAHAQSDRASLLVARQFSKEALKTTLEGMAKNTESTDRTYWGRLDTYAYVTMIATARSNAPDAKLIACAGKIFGMLTGYANATLAGTLQQPNARKFRSQFISGRYYVETFNSHRALAGNLMAMERSDVECSDTDKEYRDMLKGDL